MLMLSCSALAAVETQQLGPYNVTFDMKTDMKYQVQNRTPIESPLATSYSMQIFTNNNTRAQITITDYKNLTDSTLAVYETIFAMNFGLYGYNVTGMRDIAIDGKKGILVFGQPFPENKAVPSGLTLYRAIYWLDSIDWELAPVSAGKTSVDIASYYPQDVTEGLLSSIRVVPAKSPA
jgi:hypothetical protein